MRCFACLQPSNLTAEHIIPQALGSRFKAKLYCRVCNSHFGKTIDADLVKTFGHIATILRIKRERGYNQPYEINDVRRGLKLAHNGVKLSRRKPLVKIETREGKVVSADITARSKEELEEIRKSITTKYGILEPGRTFEERHPGPVDATYDRAFDTRPIRRAVTKIAYGLLCTKLPQYQLMSSGFDQARAFIKTDAGPDLTSLNLKYTPWMPDNVRPLHKIHISVQRLDRILVGYVMLFGIFRFTTLLSNCFDSFLEYPDFDYTHDPVTRKVVLGNDNFRAPRITENQILHPRQSIHHFRAELTRSHKSILEQYAVDLQFLGIDFKPAQQPPREPKHDNEHDS